MPAGFSRPFAQSSRILLGRPTMDLATLLELASRLARAGGHEDRYLERSMPRLLLLRQETPSPIEASLYEPVLCLILRGRKQVTFGEETFSFGPGEYLLVSHDLPVSSRVTRAPYLALLFEVDVALVRRLCDEVVLPAREVGRASAAATARAAPELLGALHRYLALADSPADAKVLGPLFSREIHYRLVTSPCGGMLRRLARGDSPASAIGRAIERLRLDLRAPIAIPELARGVGMSPAAFHGHFKAITKTTPLQYLKELRLQEARRLLRMGNVSVTTAAMEVGYESPSQFSREYARKFGLPPSRDTG